MDHYNWSEVPEEQLNPSATRRMIHGQAITIARLRLKKGCHIPTHHHVNEQICMVEQGALRFFTAAENVTVKAGESLCIPPNLPHSADVLEDSVVIDIFTPVREDWLRGDDAYLRGSPQ